jgi:hypothetical protein
MEDVHIKSYAHLVLLNKVYSSMESKRWNRARSAFLKQEIKSKGCLICSYCGKTNLKMKSTKRGPSQVEVTHLAHLTLLYVVIVAIKRKQQ